MTRFTQSTATGYIALWDFRGNLIGLPVSVFLSNTFEVKDGVFDITGRHRRTSHCSLFIAPHQKSKPLGGFEVLGVSLGRGEIDKTFGGPLKELQRLPNCRFFVSQSLLVFLLDVDSIVEDFV